jgi:hypothetical protein
MAMESADATQGLPLTTCERWSGGGCDSNGTSHDSGNGKWKVYD